MKPTPTSDVEHERVVLPRSGDRTVRAVIWLPGLAVALGAAVATAHGLFETAVAARVPAGIAWLYPLITDGLALVAYAATARLQGRAARYAWSVVVLAAGLSGLAQATYLAGDASVDASPALRFGIGAWPAIAAAVVAHLLYLLAAHHQPADPAAAAPKHHVASDPRTPARATPAAMASGPTTPSLVASGGSTAIGEATAPPVDAPTSPTTLPIEPGSMVAERDDAPGPLIRPAAVREPVQPGVHPLPDSRTAVQPDPSTPVYDATSEALSAAPTGPASAGLNTPVEHPAGPVEHLNTPAEHPLNEDPEPAPRDRARAAAVAHAARHGALPTVSELAAAAAVSRGTAAAALKTLRGRPGPLHLVPGTPEQETQP